MSHGRAPADALLAISDHARSSWNAFVAAAGRQRSVGIVLGKLAAKTFSASRQILGDHIIDAQRAEVTRPHDDRPQP